MLRAVTDEIIYEIMKLSGQEYVDEYAQRAKNRLRSGLRLAPAPRRADGRPAAAERPVTSGSGPDGA